MKIFAGLVTSLVGLRGVVEKQSVAEASASALQALTTLKVGPAATKNLVASTTVGGFLTVALQAVVWVRVTVYLINSLCGFRAASVPSQKGKRVLVTGANSGIGYYAALELARAGADVTLACRDATRGGDALKKLRAELRSSGAGGSVELLLMDLADFASVQRAATQFLSKGGHLDVLVNNAGIMAPPAFQTSAQGLEMQMTCNHTGHFLLVHLLKPALERAAQPRIVHVSSLAAWSGDNKHMGPASLKGDAAAYDPMPQYTHTKLAQHWFSQEFCRRNPASKIRSVVCHPGISATNLSTNSIYGKKLMSPVVDSMLQSSADGALPTLQAATAPYEALSKRGDSVFAPLWAMGGPSVKGYVPPNAKAASFKRQAEFWDASARAVKQWGNKTQPLM